MKTFKEYVAEQKLEEGFARNLLTAGLIGTAGLAGGCYKGQCKAPQSTQTQNQTQVDNNYHWNPEIGQYTSEQSPDGKIIYKSVKGNFVRVPSKLNPTGYKFVKI